MQDSKIIELLQTFSTKELRVFEEFMYSPFFNKNEELRNFYAYLKSCAPTFQPNKIKRRVVFKKLYPQKDYDDKKMNYLMSDLLKLAEQYIGWQQYENDSHLQKCHVLSAYLDRNLEKHYQGVYRTTERKLQQIPTRNTNFYYQQYLLAEIAERHFEQQKLRVFNHRLQAVANYFDVFYLSKKLELTVEMLEWEQVLKHNYQVDLIDDLLPQLHKSAYQSIPPLSLYQHMYYMLKGENAMLHFDQLKLKLQTYFDQFDPKEMKKAYLSAINFSMREIRKGNARFQQELLDLYLTAIEKKLLFENGYLSPWTYKNVVKLGLIMNRLDWTKQFIEQYTDALEPTFRQDAFHYSMADLFYHKKAYAKAQQHLREVQFSDIFYSLGTRQMLSKIYFEQGEKDTLLSLIASFKIFLKRNQLISEKVRQTYENFLFFLAQLLKDHPSEDLEEQIRNTVLLPDRSWLLEQLLKS